jgi:membrane protease YdiL (CAAX protease family)
MNNQSQPHTAIPTPTETYSLGATLILYLSIFSSYEFVTITRSRFFDSDDQYSIYYDSPLSVLIVVGIVLCHRPRLLTLSRWVPRPIDFAISVPLGALIVGAERFLLPAKFHVSVLDPKLLPVIIVGSAAEEVLFRGTILRSLQERVPVWTAVLLVTFLAAIDHENFWLAIPGQVALSLVYLKLGNSLPASIILHITINSVVLLEIGQIRIP